MRWVFDIALQHVDRVVGCHSDDHQPHEDVHEVELQSHQRHQAQHAHGTGEERHEGQRSHLDGAEAEEHQHQYREEADDRRSHRIRLDDAAQGAADQVDSGEDVFRMTVAHGHQGGGNVARPLAAGGIDVDDRHPPALLLLQEARGQFDEVCVSHVRDRHRLLWRERLREQVHVRVEGFGTKPVLSQSRLKGLADAFDIELVRASGAEPGDDLLLLVGRRNEGGDGLERGDGVVAHQRFQLGRGRARFLQSRLHGGALADVHHEVERLAEFLRHPLLIDYARISLGPQILNVVAEAQSSCQQRADHDEDRPDANGERRPRQRRVDEPS